MSTTNLGRTTKIIDLAAFAEVRTGHREAGDRVVLSHGVFDLLHPGHLNHLERARALGDVVVVSVTADRFVDRGPGRPVFSQDHRMMMLAALHCVDYVLLSDAPDALPVIEVVQPDIYAKGADHAARSGAALERETERVAEFGGELRLFGGAMFSSTRLLNTHFSVLPLAARSFAESFIERHDFDDVQRIAAQMEDLTVLVVGDVIIDEYISCDVQGLTGKESVLSVRERSSQRQWGGSFAVARHLAQFCGRVTLSGIAGPSEPLASPDGVDVPEEIERSFEVDENARTVVKRRFVLENKMRAELTKLFAVHEFTDPGVVSKDTRQRFIERVAAMVPDYDVVVVTDYGHGLLDGETMEMLQQTAPFLALNCQTNSSNYGYNLITKYHRADTFCLDAAELNLAFADRHSPREDLLRRLAERLQSKQAWLTLGAEGSIGVDPEGEISRAPALTLDVRDTLGAGDAYFALASLCAALDAPIEMGTFFGNLAGALAANVVGNTEPIDRHGTLKFASAVMAV